MSQRIRSSADTIRRTLENEMMSGRLMPGARVDENGLAKRFGVSRTPIREALLQLSARGLVKLRGRQGAIVSQLSISDLLDAFQVVAVLEGLCARLAARRMTREQHTEMRRFHELCIDRAREDDVDGFYETNKQFHESVYAGSHNRFLQDEIHRMRLLVAPSRRYVTLQPGRMRESLDEHEAVMEAIIRGDPDAADAAMTAHVNLLGDRFSDFVAVMSANEEPKLQAADN